MIAIWSFLHSKNSWHSIKCFQQSKASYLFLKYLFSIQFHILDHYPQGSGEWNHPHPPQKLTLFIIFSHTIFFKLFFLHVFKTCIGSRNKKFISTLKSLEKFYMLWKNKSDVIKVYELRESVMGVNYFSVKNN